MKVTPRLRRLIDRRLREATPETDAQVLRPVSGMRPGQVLACSISLLVAGILLARGFIGLIPGRPAFVVLGVGLAASAVAGLVLDHVQVRSSRQRPDHVLVDELNRSRRFGHSLTVVRVSCSEATGWGVIGRMRSTDRAWHHRGAVMAMLPETDLEGAAEFLHRIADLSPPRSVRMATFPADALTVDGLYAALDAAVPVPVPVPAPARNLVAVGDDEAWRIDRPGSAAPGRAMGQD